MRREDGAAGPIAIIGFSFRLPGDADSPESFWKMLLEGKCTARKVPEERFNVDAFYHPDTRRLDTLPVQHGNFVKHDISAFDAPFFSIRASEAAAMDPQSRSLLESTYHALENAGIPYTRAAGTKTCVYTGVSADDYRLMYTKDFDRPIQHAATGMAMSMLANKISWFYDFKGPSVQLDTACSASLNALHLACQSLRTRESDMGIVAGANLFFSPESMSPLAHMNFFSPDGRSYSFDHRANGYSRGEGFGAFVLKRISDAVADGDIIRAVVRATGSSENGRTPGGITKVNSEAQRDLIHSTYRSAGLSLDRTRYVEAHGPGTEGDYFECAALASVFEVQRRKDEPLYVGSVKANIGHLEGTSGIASLAKAVLMLERGVMPKLANFETLHPKIEAEGWNMKFLTENQPWPSGLRRLSINSFGFGGANSHAVLDDAYHCLSEMHLEGHHATVIDPDQNTIASTTLKTSLANGVSHDIEGNQPRFATHTLPKLLVWSAADEHRIRRISELYKDHFDALARTDGLTSEFAQDLAYTMSQRRSALPWKSFSLTSGITDGQQNLIGSLSKPIRSLSGIMTIFTFTGQGAQYARMGSGLQAIPVFRDSLQWSQNTLSSLKCAWNLSQELARDLKTSAINDPALAQPLCTILQIALVDTLRHYGIQPSAVVGHSSGEIAAAYCCGALSQRSAIKVAYFRGLLASRLAQSAKSQGMLAAALSVDEAKAYLTKLQISTSSILDIACVNSPKSITFSGDERQLDRLQRQLEIDSIFTRRLKVNVAYHSARMNSIAKEYASCLGRLEHGDDCVYLPRMCSSVTADWVSNEELQSSQYWVRNLVSQVQYEGALGRAARNILSANRSVTSNKHLVLIEIGPHPALNSPSKDVIDAIHLSASTRQFASLHRQRPDIDSIFNLLGNLHCTGCPLDLVAINQYQDSDRQPRLLSNLPEYPFDHSRKHWHESRLAKAHRFRKYARNDLLGSRIFDWNKYEARWRNIIRHLENPWIEDHRIGGSLIYPGAGMLVMAIEALNQYIMDIDSRRLAGVRFKDVHFLNTLKVSLQPDGVETEIFLTPRVSSSRRPLAERWFDFRLYVLENQEWSEVCKAQISADFGVDHHTQSMKREVKLRFEAEHKKFSRLSNTCTSALSGRKMYRRFRSFGLDLGPTFQVFEDIRFSPAGNVAAASIQLQKWLLRGDMEHSSPHLIHPTALDGVLQMPVPALCHGASRAVPTMVPSHIKSMWLSVENTGSNSKIKSIRGVAQAKIQGLRSADSEVIVIDPINDDMKCIVQGLEYTIVGATTLAKRGIDTGSCLSMKWLSFVETVDDPNLEPQPSPADITSPDRVCIVLSDCKSGTQTRLGKALCQQLSRRDHRSADLMTLLDLNDERLDKHNDANITFVFVCDWQYETLIDLGPANYISLHRILLSGARVLWVTTNRSVCAENMPIGLSTGLLRAIQTERPELSMTSIHFDLKRYIDDDSLNSVSKCVEAILRYTLTQSTADCESEFRFSQSEGGFDGPFIPRVQPADRLDLYLEEYASSGILTQKPFSSTKTSPVSLTIQSPGLLDTLLFVPDPIATKPLEPDEILVSSSYVGLNFLDVLTALGRIPNVSTLGAEASGIVVASGSSTDLRPGDRVVALTDGTLKTQFRAHYLTAAKIIDDISLSDAASITSNLCTVYRALIDVAHLGSGESILIHAGAGGTGQLAIQLALHLGAIVYVTVGSDKKKQLIHSLYDIPESHIFHSRDASFALAIQRITIGKGVDVVLNSLSGELLDVAWEDCIAPFGRWIELGKADINEGRSLNMRTFLRNVSFACVDLSGIWRERPAMMRKLLTKALRLVEEGKMKPAQPVKMFSIAEVEGAMRTLQNNADGGKVVIYMDPDTEIKVLQTPEWKWEFGEDKSYVIAGGLGGLGKVVLQWMVERGAKHLIVISRSGDDTIEKKEFVEFLRGMGAEVRVVKCDIADKEALKRALEGCADMPEVRGCVQASMVLKDSYFDKMTHEQFRVPVPAKVHGSFNLHTLLPKSLDFFILLSSLSGIIGQPGQANYAAANTFQDALARHRIALGMKAVSLDLGMMNWEGVVSENENLRSAMESTGWYRLMETEELRGLLEFFCDPNYDMGSEWEGQVVCGIERPANRRVWGKEEPVWMKRPMFRALGGLPATVEGGSVGAGGAGVDKGGLRKAVEAAATVDEAGRLVMEHLAEKISASIGVARTEIEGHKPLHAYGVDSLAAMEVRSWFAQEVMAEVAVFDILSNVGLEALCIMAVKKSAFWSGDGKVDEGADGSQGIIDGVSGVDGQVQDVAD